MMYKKMLVLGLALAISTVAAQVTSAAIITGIERRNSSNTYPEIAGPLVEDALAFVDRTASTRPPRGHRYAEVPMALLGAEYIMPANDDRYIPNYELDVTLSQRAVVYLLLDNRLGHGYNPGDYRNLEPSLAAAGMNWVTNLGFSDTGMNIGFDLRGDGDIDNWSSVYAKEFGSGTITFYHHDDSTGTSYRNMYSIAVVPEPTTLLLLGLGGLMVRRKRQRH